VTHMQRKPATPMFILMALAALVGESPPPGWAGETTMVEAPAVSAPPAEAGSEAPAGPADAPVPRPFRHGPVRHLTAAQSLDESVRRLARSLDLDQDQQTKLRQILVDQYRQIMKPRRGMGVAPASATETSLAIYGQTRARIRSMLNDEQRKKYPAEVPRDQTAPAQADLQHWMQMQESKRLQDDGASP
jgi:hypothetical protein